MKLSVANIKITEKGIIPQIMTWVIPLSCILVQYHAVVLTYGLLALLIMALLIAIRNKGFYFDRDFLLLGLFISTQQFVSSVYFRFSISTSFYTALTIWLIIISCSTSWVVKNKEVLYRNYSIIGSIATCAIYVQFVLYYVFGIKTGSIMILRQAEKYIGNWVTNSNRPAGFFSEPQTHCTYMLPLIIIALEKKNYKFAIFLTLGVVLTGSSLGVMMTAFLWLYTLFFSSVKKSRKIGSAIVLILGSLAFFTLEPLEPAKQKLFTVFNDFSAYSSAQMINSYSYSNYLRLIKGWVTYNEMPFNAKFIGVGITNFISYLQSSGVSFSWNAIWNADATMAAYFTSAAGVFIECGILVGILYYVFMYKKIKQGSEIGKKLILVLFLQSFLTQDFFNGVFIFYILMYYVSLENTKSYIKIKIR